MAFNNQDRTYWRQAETVSDFQGIMTEELRSLLRAFGENEDIPVKTFTDREGSRVLKYRVVIMLPDGLAPNPTQPSGESISKLAAYHEALVQALTIIREFKAADLYGTSFMAIPHDGRMSEMPTDHQTLVKNKP